MDATRKKRILWGTLLPPLGFYRLTRWAGAGRGWAVAVAVVAPLVLLGVLGAILDSGGSSSSNPSESAASSAVTESVPTTKAKTKPKPSGPTSEQRDVAERSQKYVDDARLCLGASVTSFQIAASGNVQAASDNISKARDICEQIRSELLDKNTHGFSDQADTVWGAVDAMKSADNAALAYLDTLQPSKLSDAKRHEADANGLFADGVRAMNARRRELGIPRLKKLKLG